MLRPLHRALQVQGAALEQQLKGSCKLHQLHLCRTSSEDNVNLPEFKARCLDFPRISACQAVMLAALRSIVPDEWAPWPEALGEIS